MNGLRACRLSAPSTNCGAKRPPLMLFNLPLSQAVCPSRPTSGSKPLWPGKPGGLVLKSPITAASTAYRPSSQLQRTGRWPNILRHCWKKNTSRPRNFLRAAGSSICSNAGSSFSNAENLPAQLKPIVATASLPQTIPRRSSLKGLSPALPAGSCPIRMLKGAYHTSIGPVPASILTPTIQFAASWQALLSTAWLTPLTGRT